MRIKPIPFGVGEPVRLTRILAKCLPAIFLVAFAICVNAQPTWHSSATNSGSSSSASIGLPSGLAVGDLMIVGLMLEKGSSLTVTPPSDWTMIDWTLIESTNTSGSTNLGMRSYWKIASSTDVSASSFDFALSATSKWTISNSRFTGYNSSTPIGVHGGTPSNSNASTATAPSITTTDDDALIVAFYGIAANSTVSSLSSGQTQRHVHSDNDVVNLMTTFVQATAGATGAKTATFSGSARRVGQQIAINNESCDCSDFAMPADSGSTVSCSSAAVVPDPPSVTDGCDNVMTPSGPFVGGTYNGCEGTITYTYTYQDCDSYTYNWVYTYTIDYSGGLTAPTSTTSTVSCPADAVDPGAPANITDACGRTVSAELVGSTQTPNPVVCEGTVVWTYRYTACDGTTTADWTHTYTIDYSGGLTAPSSTTSTVSCPADAVDPGAPANITDACGRTVSAELVGSTQTPNPVVCEGTVVWTYRYTACDGTTTADWTHTYTVDYSGGLTAPTSTTSTVSCPVDAVDPGAPADITDACGRTVSAELVGSTQTPNPVVCEGTVVWTYRYTACDGTTTADWTHTYTIDYSGGLTAPTSTTSTVSCPADAVDPGAPANITDACGRTVSAELVGSTQTPNPVVCEGTVVWTYRYTACDGTTTADWTHTYTIDYSGGLTAPTSTTSTVSCPADAVDPGAPANITDACGRTVSAELVGSTQTPNPVVCEGTVVWTYRYTACDGTTTADWTHTYTVDYSGGLTAPTSTTSTVSCPADAVDPGAPANITDACGRSVSAVLVGSTQTPNPVVCEGTVVWTYRYTACDGTTTADWTHTYTVDYSGGLTAPSSTTSTVSCPADAVDPGAPANITDACGRSVSAVLVGSTQTPNPVVCEGTVVWTYRYTACDGTTTADWTHTYTVDYSGGLTAPTNTTSTVSCPADAVDPGAPANITDACGRTVSAELVGSTQTPNPVVCEGTVVWTYRYTACDGTTTADWTHTYTVDYSGGLTAPTNTTSTVSCPADAVDPGAPANITDACGRSVSAELVGSTQTPNPVVCEGTVVWTYRYTACDGTTTADWTHTYTIDYSGGLTAPSSTTSTISCPADAVDPGAPANITDACGRTVSAELVGSTQTPNPVVCEGTVVWTYRYTACDGTTTADWTHTYTIDYSGGLTAPTSTTSTVSCPADAVDPGAPANITDACGRTVSAELVGSTQTPNPVVCEGTVVWTYRYTACDGTTTADWTHTYTVEIGDFNMPPNEGNDIACSTDVADITPPTVVDNCGNTIVPTGPSIGGGYDGCDGTVTYTWTYEDCAGNSHDWVYTYTVDPVAPTWVSKTSNVGKAGTDATISVPSGTNVGDLLVVGLMFKHGSSVTITPPSGWTLILRTNRNTNIGMATYYKYHTSGGTSYTWGLNYSPQWSIAMSRITGANPTSPIEAAAGNTGVKEYDAEAPSITTGGCQTLNMVFYTNKKKANFTPASGTTERYDHPNDSEDQPANMMATYVQSSAGESGTKTAVASDKEEWVTQTIAIRSCLNEDLARPAVADESNGQPVTGNGNYIFKMWPNPSSGNVHFEFRSTDVQISGIRVFDMMGRVVMTLPVGQYHQLFETDLNLTQQPDGMYIIQAISNDEVLHSSTVVLHR